MELSPCKSLLPSNMDRNDVFNGESSKIWKIHSNVLVCTKQKHYTHRMYLYFRAVTFQMFEFFASYIWLALGFVIAFMILFSGVTKFRESSIVSVFVMMLGEVEFNDIYFQEREIVAPVIDEANNTLTQIIQKDRHQPFPGSSQTTLKSSLQFFLNLFFRHCNHCPNKLHPCIQYCHHESSGWPCSLRYWRADENWDQRSVDCTNRTYKPCP